MCMEKEQTEILFEQEKADIMYAVKIIKEFEPDIKAIRVMIDNQSKRLDEEVEERKEEIEKIKVNYLDRFKRLESLTKRINNRVNDKLDDFKNFVKDYNKEIKDELKNTNKLVVGLFTTIIIMFLGSTTFILLNAVFNWIIF
jgi:gas vesicle protein